MHGQQHFYVTALAASELCLQLHNLTCPAHLSGARRRCALPLVSPQRDTVDVGEREVVVRFIADNPGSVSETQLDRLGTGAATLLS